MIFVKDGFNIELSRNELGFDIFTYEKIILRPKENKLITLPYYREVYSRYANFELCFNLAQNITLLWSNLNSEKARQNLQFLIRSNMNEILPNNDLLGAITGKNNIIIKSGELFGHIFVY